MSKTQNFPVIVESFNPVKNADGEQFHQIVLTQEALIPRKADGTLYMGTKTCRITSAWSEEKCKRFIGKELVGFNIEKVECEAYQSSVSGVEETYTHTWALVPA